jgi:hypothetical protein
VVVISGRDLVDMLKASGLETVTALRRHLRDTYPPRV